MRCSRCGYEWRPKVPSPKECPRCKARLDYRTPTPPGTPVEKKLEVSKGMPSKLPWLATAVIIVVAVGAAAWLWPTAAAPGWTQLTPAVLTLTRVENRLIINITAMGLQSGQYGSYGIENIYIIKSTFNSGTSGDAQLDDNVHATINQSGQEVNIPYEENFGIAVEFIVRGDNVAYFRLENVYEYISITGAFSETDNQLNAGTDWSETRLTGTTKGGITDNATAGAVGKYYKWDVMRVQSIKDNNGNWYKLGAGESINFTLTVYSWK